MPWLVEVFSVVFALAIHFETNGTIGPRMVNINSHDKCNIEMTVSCAAGIMCES